MRVAVIGGGPSGLVQLKVLLEAHEHFPIAPIEARLFEASDKIGGVFSHSYEDGELVSSKFLTTFSDFRPDADEPDFMSTERYLEYLDAYASHFRLWPHMAMGTRIESVRRGDSSAHVVKYQLPDGGVEEWECDAVAVCSGVHSIPHIPHIEGIENVPVAMHSADFKTRAQLGKDKTVMIVGSGETAADIAYLSITADTKRVVMCHRDGFIGAPKRVPSVRFFPWVFGDDPMPYPQLPVDVSQVTLFDTMYVHPTVRDSMIIWNHYHIMALPFGCWLAGGTPHGMDQCVGEVFGERFDVSRLFFNKAWSRVDQAISWSYRPEKWSLATRIRRFFMDQKIYPPKRPIDLAPTPSHIDADGIVHFPLTGRPEAERIQENPVKPDIVILATGYLPSFPFLNTADNKGRRAYPDAFDADVRQIWKADDPTIGFIGFIRPGFGAIPPLAELQAMMFAQNLLQRIPRPLDPDDEWHYRIIHTPDARVSYGVEHDSYAYQLAKDMGCAPSFTEIIKAALVTPRGYRLPWIWASGANFTTKFRITGPWKWEKAAQTMVAPELWQTITRREGPFNNYCGMGIVPMVLLGACSLFYSVYTAAWSVLAKIRLVRPWEHRIEPKLKIAALARRAEMQKQMQKTNGSV